MPNWCSTNITINCDDNKKTKEFYNKLKEWTSYNYCENGFGLSWLGNIVGNSKIGTVDEDENTDLSCRGSITYMDLDAGQIVIDTETAWTPMLKMWVELTDEYLPDAEIIYTAEEGGCGIFCTNDPILEGRYLVDSWEDDLYENMTEEQLLEYLKKKCNTDENDVDTLLEVVDDEGLEIYVHQWEYSSVDDWD